MMRSCFISLLAAALPLGLAAQDKTTVLWSGNNMGSAHAISPDGRMLAYIADTNIGIRDLPAGTSRIIVREVRTPAADPADVGRQIVSESAGEVVFSDDGSRVAYSWAKHRLDVYEVRITEVREGGSTHVVENRKHSEHDGPYLAFRRR